MVFASLIIAFLGLSATAVATSVPIPIPSGPYGVSLKTGDLTLHGRLDPYAPVKQDRRLMLSIFYPNGGLRKGCNTTTTTAYMPPTTAETYDQIYGSLGLPNGTFESLVLTLCNTVGAGGQQNHVKYPVVIFSPGLGNSRLLYSAMAASMSSEGFVVITVDHPYDATVVEYPDGSSVLAANITTDDQIVRALQVRAEDVSCVVQLLRDGTLPEALRTPGHGTLLDIDRIFLHGHSLGGATAAEAMMRSGSNVRAGINLDGSFFGDVMTSGGEQGRPFMIVGHEGKSLQTDPSWWRFWSRFKGPEVLVGVNGTVHGSFTDFPILVDVLGIRNMLPSDVLAPLVGTVGGERMLEIVSGVTKAFYDFARCQSGWKQLREDVNHVPEAKVLQAAPGMNRSCPRNHGDSTSKSLPHA